MTWKKSIRRALLTIKMYRTIISIISMFQFGTRKIGSQELKRSQIMNQNPESTLRLGIFAYWVYIQ